MHAEFWRGSPSGSPLESPTRKYNNGIEICLLSYVGIADVEIYLGSWSLTYFSIITVKLQY